MGANHSKSDLAASNTTSDLDRDLDGLVVGDTFRLAGELHLVVTGVCEPEDAPEHAEGVALYQAELRQGRDAESERTLLYAAHNLEHALDAGAAYVGLVDVDDPVEPFWCDGCGHPHRDGDRRSSMIGGADGDVCSYGCAVEVDVEARKTRYAAESDTEDRR